METTCGQKRLLRIQHMDRASAFQDVQSKPKCFQRQWLSDRSVQAHDSLPYTTTMTTQSAPRHEKAERLHQVVVGIRLDVNTGTDAKASWVPLELISESGSRADDRKAPPTLPPPPLTPLSLASLEAFLAGVTAVG